MVFVIKFATSLSQAPTMPNIYAQDLFDALDTNDINKAKNAIETIIAMKPIHDRFVLNRGEPLNKSDEMGLDVVNDDGMTPLLLAAEKDAIWVKLLLDHNVNPNKSNDAGQTALLQACESFTTDQKAADNQEKIVQLLLNKKADVHAKNSEGETALYFAAFHQKPAIIKMLLSKGAKPDHKDFIESLQSLDENTEVVRLLLEANADPNTIDPETGRTPLHLTAELGHRHITKLLLEAKANPNNACPIDEKKDSTPLAMAVENEDEELVKILLCAKASPDTTFHLPSGEFSVLNTATKMGASGIIVQALLEAGANPIKTDIEVVKQPKPI